MEKTKTNKKSKSSLIVLLVAILLCVAIVLSLSGVTLAKYISSKEVSTQTANVAKWGYVISADESNLFGDAYGYDSSSTKNGVIIDYGTTGATVGVKATADANDTNKGYSDVVAPGTSGSMTFSVTGIAEVRSAITIAANYDTTNTTYSTVQLKDSSNNVLYEPIKWTLTPSNGTATTYNSYDAMITALNALSDGKTAIEPGTKQNLSYTLSWVWAFDTTDDSSSNYLYDTILGAFMAADTYKDYTSDKPYEFTSGNDGTDSTNADTQVRIYSNSGSLVVQSLAKGKDWSNDSGDIVTYTANTSVNLDLKITVEQVQGTATTETEDGEDENS